MSEINDYELRVKLRGLFSEKHMFVKNEMKKTSKWKKIKYWIKSHLNNKVCFNVFLFFPVWALVSLQTFGFIQSNFIQGEDLTLAGTFSLIWLCFGGMYTIFRTIDIATDRGAFSDLLFLNKENKEEYWHNFLKESVSLNIYKFLCENLSKEELMLLADGRKSITYKDLWITSSYTSELSNYAKNKKEKELFDDKNKKLTHFLEVMHDELNKK